MIVKLKCYTNDKPGITSFGGGVRIGSTHVPTTESRKIGWNLRRAIGWTNFVEAKVTFVEGEDQFTKVEMLEGMETFDRFVLMHLKPAGLCELPTKASFELPIGAHVIAEDKDGAVTELLAVVPYGSKVRLTYDGVIPTSAAASGMGMTTPSLPVGPDWMTAATATITVSDEGVVKMTR